MITTEDKSFIDDINFQLLSPKPSIAPLNNTNRKYYTHPNYFNKIDNECKAYFMGLLWTDGCNCNNRISINLQERDGYILDKIASQIFVNKPPLLFRPKVTPYRQNQLCLNICSKSIAEHLKKNGLVPRKSAILKMPSTTFLPDSLFNHFLRGVFDGDGCAHSHHMRYSLNHHNRLVPRGRFNFNIVSIAPDFIYGLQEKIEKLVGVKTNLRCSDKSHIKQHYKPLYVLDVNKYRELESLYRYLYKNATFYLERKRYKFDLYFQHKHYYHI